MSAIDRSEPVPIYYQLKRLIAAQIERGEILPGEQLPTEEELCERYGISRTPVRQALLELVREGVLVRSAGRGTFVAPSAAESVTLRVVVPDQRWQWLLEEAAVAWGREHRSPTISLSFETVPLAELHDRLSLAVAQGQAPDFSVLDSVWVAEFAHRRYLCPLAELDPNWTSEIQPGFYPSVLAANCYLGEQYAVPTNADATGLWYRRDWLTAEHVAPPRTWDELLAVGRHFRRARVRARYGYNPYPLAFVGGTAGGETTTYQLLPFIWSAGGQVIDENEVALNSSATRRALAFLRRLVHPEAIAGPQTVSQPWDGAASAFARGEVVLAFGGTYESFLIQSIAGWDRTAFLERAGFMPLPAGPTGQPATVVGGMTFGIYRQSRYPEVALSLLKQALTPEVLKPFSLRTGQNPAFRPAAEAIRPEEDGFLGHTEAIFAQGRSRPSLPAYDRISQQLQNMVAVCLTGELEIEAAVARTAERISGITGLPLT